MKKNKANSASIARDSLGHEMVLCGPECDCRWCILTEMSMHSPFKENIDALIAEFRPVFVVMRRTREENRRASSRARQLSRNVEMVD